MVYHRVLLFDDVWIRHVYVSARPHGTSRPPTGRILVKFDIWGFLKKSFEKIQVSLKSDNHWYFVRIPTYMWDRASLEQRCEQPTRCNTLRLLIFFNQHHMFRAGDKLANPHERFLTVYTALVQCTDIAADRWQGSDSILNLVTGRQRYVYRCIVPKAVYTVKKRSWGWASLLPETCRADWKRSINGICCILLVAYIVDLHSFLIVSRLVLHRMRNVSDKTAEKKKHTFYVQ